MTDLAHDLIARDNACRTYDRMRENGAVRAAAHEALKIAADTYAGSRRALGVICRMARDHGLSLDELVADTDLTHAEVAQLLKEASR